ncbi:Uncharacterised protein [Mycolicibacterium phlei]|uniref:oxygenase MpaB family protein n=1 Tax=Mycobacteroides chelonae TaxID=1774 RepID=UPI0007B4524D|nr:oxygenase MpaB family protein [Mycobacteroides chelonae]ANB00469.1 hypothetical protein BB28_23225 [Mycobacteroides chelonae CCUG 47445]VEG20423.1 Uncharacterised protein [Mycolicibacterium phlei]
MTIQENAVLPAAYAENLAHPAPAHTGLRNTLRRWTGFDLTPSEEVVRQYGAGLWITDPVAESFVEEVYYGQIGPERGRALLERALSEGIDAVEDAPESMRALFAEFDTLPPWADPQLIEAGAAVWRRWGYDMGSIANAGTMDTYTEGWLATPLSLAGGYAGQGAMHRHLETSRWWLECARPGAALDRYSVARQITMKIRVMHVSVRRGVRKHPEWRREQWGEPISQSEMLLTLIAGSVAPGLGLWAVGYLTTRSEMIAALHFCRYLGYLLGVRCDDIYPETVADAVRILYHFDATRAYDGGDASRELVESFVPSFTPSPGSSPANRLRGLFHLQLQAGFTRLFMLPWNRRLYRIPNGWLGTAALVARAPFVAAIELARHAVPAVDQRWQRGKMRRWEHWIDWQSGAHTHDFQDLSAMRR